MQKFIKYLDQAIYWTIVAIPFSIAIAPAITNSLMGSLLFFFILKKIIKRERFFINTSIYFPFILLILVSVISFKNSLDFGTSFRGIVKLIQNALIFLICADQIKDRKHVSRIVLAIILGASLASIDALWQVTFGKDFIRGNSLIENIGLRRATAAFPDANVLGVYLSAIAPIIIGLAIFYFKGAKRLFARLIEELLVALPLFSLGGGIGTQPIIHLFL